MENFLNLHEYPVKDVLELLLKDKTSKKNIIWATDAYVLHGSGFSDKSQITKDAFYGMNAIELRPRISKAFEEQQERTRKKAEVFTPVWLCNKMINFIDEDWFGIKDVFNIECQETGWETIFDEIKFSGKKWTKYVDSRRLEITCGEAPYLVSRYDAATGNLIEPPQIRIGILDRKLRIVDENTKTVEEWEKWAVRALQSCYGFEYQGDSLLIARINILMTFYDHYMAKWNKKPDHKLLKHVANIIAWNIWQMDGLKDTIPLGKPHEEYHQMSIFEFMVPEDVTKDEGRALPCKIYDWRSNESLLYKQCKEKGKTMGKKLFDYVIGNPPYMEQSQAETTRMPPVYDKFMDVAYELADVIELITPARFLFNAGQTQKSWNEKMLNDKHLKVLYYEQNAVKVFANTDIKGGVAITYYDNKREFEPIGIFTPWEELRSIKQKAGAKTVADSLSDIADSSPTYNLKNIYEEHPDYKKYIADDGRHSQLKTNVLNINPIFTDTPKNEDDYKIYGLVNGKRGYKFCERKFIKQEHKSLSKYKVLIPKAVGSGQLSDTFPDIFVVGKDTGFTQTYISIGMFEAEAEAKHLEKYVKTKFCRVLLYVLKVTQDNLPAVWRYIPKQDFSVNSDIDWAKSIHEIDLQLYHKYNLTKEEIEFVETNVKEMV